MKQIQVINVTGFKGPSSSSQILDILEHLPVDFSTSENTKKPKNQRKQIKKMNSSCRTKNPWDELMALIHALSVPGGKVLGQPRAPAICQDLGLATQAPSAGGMCWELVVGG